VANKTLGQLRRSSRPVDLVDKSTWLSSWVVDFPMFEWNEEDQKWDAAHQPSPCPKMEDLPKFETDPAPFFPMPMIWYAMLRNGLRFDSYPSPRYPVKDLPTAG
jgi:aspartyl-tRNA synthetase